MAVLTRTELDNLIRDRLASDPDFREKLLANPRATVESLVNTSTPEAVTIAVHEESLAHVHIVIPAAASGGELADDDLELVSGGVCWANCSDYGHWA